MKVDDLSRPYHTAEIEAIRKAIDKVGRPMVLSTSPGATPVAEGPNVADERANMWRISDDFWDHWPALLEQFARLRDWTPYRAAGHFPDADMLPLGVLQMGRAKTRVHGRGADHAHDALVRRTLTPHDRRGSHEARRRDAHA